MKITTAQFNELKQQTDVAAILKAVGVEVEDEAWPKDGDQFWCIDNEGNELDTYYNDDAFDRFQQSLNNVHRTREDAEHYKATTIRRWQAECAIRNWRDKHCPFKADETAVTQLKWINRFDRIGKYWEQASHNSIHYVGEIHFATAADAKACLAALPSEWEVLRETGG